MDINQNITNIRLTDMNKQYLRSRRKQFRKLEALCGFFFGLALGLLFYKFILTELEFNKYATQIFGGAFCLILAIVNALSRQIRCIEMLTGLKFFGKVGRAVLKTLILTYLISGPLVNLSHNGREVARVVACSTALTYNLTKTKLDLLLLPFTNALQKLKTDFIHIKDSLYSIKDIDKMLTNEIEGESKGGKRSDDSDRRYEESDSDQYANKYLDKVQSVCERQLAHAGHKCRNTFHRIYETCKHKITWAVNWLLCAPLKLSFLCNIGQSLGNAKICHAKSSLGTTVGKGYVAFKNVKSGLMKGYNTVKLVYEVAKVKAPQYYHQAIDTVKGIMNSVNQKQALFNFLLIFVKRVLAFIFLHVILSAQKYHDKYLRQIDFDNIYITKYFRKIDARRNYREQRTLLPLKKIEQSKFVETFKIKLLKKEKAYIFQNSLTLLVEIAIVSTVIIIDRLLYEVLDLINRHAEITLEQTGHHDLIIDVQGTGPIAKAFRAILTGFNVKKRIKIVQSNKPCLPVASLLPSSYLHKIYGIFFIIWLLIVLESYGQRLRHCVCARFYPKREKQRILFLYNETLKRRRGFFKYMRRKVMYRIRQDRLEYDLNFFIMLRIRFPRWFNWLRFFNIGARRCVICNDVESLRTKRNLKYHFVRCGNPDCHVVYCSECWFDIHKICLACSLYNEAETSVTEESEDSKAHSDF